MKQCPVPGITSCTWFMMYGYALLVPMNQRVFNNLSKERNISGNE